MSTSYFGLKIHFDTKGWGLETADIPYVLSFVIKDLDHYNFMGGIVFFDYTITKWANYIRKDPGLTL